MTSLSPPLQAVVALFRGPLASVRFADIDAAGLSNLAAEVEGAAEEVEQQEAKLVELRQSLAQRQEALHGLAQQALAYARIYAENDEVLSAELNDIALPRATKPRKAAPAKAAGGRADGAARSADGALQSEQASDEAAEAAASDAPEADTARTESDDADGAPAEAAPAFGRRKIKRKLARASASGSSV